MSDYKQWARDGAVVDARYAMGPGVHARGVVYGYVDRPTLLLRCADGSTTSWVADLCRPASVEDVVQFAADQARAARSEYSIQPPIRPGTARRLGLRQPSPPPQWLVDMAAKVDLMHWKLDMIDRMYGNKPGTWRLRAQQAGRRDA